MPEKWYAPCLCVSVPRRDGCIRLGAHPHVSWWEVCHFTALCEASVMIHELTNAPFENKHSDDRAALSAIIAVIEESVPMAVGAHCISDNKLLFIQSSVAGRPWALQASFRFSETCAYIDLVNVLSIRFVPSRYIDPPLWMPICHSDAYKNLPAVIGQAACTLWEPSPVLPMSCLWGRKC